MGLICPAIQWPKPLRQKEEREKRNEVYPPFRRNPESFGSAAPEATRDKENHPARLA